MKKSLILRIPLQFRGHQNEPRLDCDGITKKVKRFGSFLIAFIIALCLYGCRGIELENKTEQISGYTLPQAMILIANERNRYENRYSESIWDIRVGSDGTGFDKLIVQNVMEYMENLMELGLLAQERGISVTSAERDRLRYVIDDYMSGLTREDLDYIGCERDDVQKLYTDYFTACKLIEDIESGVDSDISDSEAKVIKIEQIGTAEQKKALAILKRVKIDGANFSSMASRYTELDTIERTLLKSSDEDEDLLERTAFSLEEGEISNILAMDDMYYIIRVVDGYAEEETAERKDMLQTAINNVAIEEVLAPYQEEHRISFTEGFWSEISFSDDGGSTVENFFDVYSEYYDVGVK